MHGMSIRHCLTLAVALTTMYAVGAHAMDVHTNSTHAPRLTSAIPLPLVAVSNAPSKVAVRAKLAYLHVETKTTRDSYYGVGSAKTSRVFPRLTISGLSTQENLSVKISYVTAEKDDSDARSS